MSKFLTTTFMAAALALSASPAIADDIVSESRSVDARVLKVKLGGVINLNVKQGATPSLMLYGDKRYLDKVTVSQHGETLSIDSDTKRWSFGKNDKPELRAELTLPNLNEFTSHGVGSSNIKGFTGNAFTLTLDGAGSVAMQSNYRNFAAHLGGVGSMNLHPGDTDEIDLNLRGAGQITIRGQTRMLRAKLGGVGSLDAEKLRADTVELDMSGLGSANVYATQTANVRLSGLGSANVKGNPANRSATARGLGKVNWN